MSSSQQGREIPANEWTPQRVGEALSEALKWCAKSGGRVGPAGFGSGMPQIIMDDFDRLAEQWPLIRDTEPEPMRRSFSAADVSRMERVLMWQAEYLSDRRDECKALNIWLICKVKRGLKYGEAISAAGMSRATAYRQRDKALSIIGQRLTAAQIERGRH